MSDEGTDRSIARKITKRVPIENLVNFSGRNRTLIYDFAGAGHGVLQAARFALSTPEPGSTVIHSGSCRALSVHESSAGGAYNDTEPADLGVRVPVTLRYERQNNSSVRSGGKVVQADRRVSRAGQGSHVRSGADRTVTPYLVIGVTMRSMVMVAAECRTRPPTPTHRKRGALAWSMDTRSETHCEPQTIRRSKRQSRSWGQVPSFRDPPSRPGIRSSAAVHLD